MSGQAQLRAQGPLEMLDSALLLVRRGGGARLVRALLAATPLALLALALYYLERVEGVRSLRPAFAVLFVVAFFTRCLLLSDVARHYALLLRPTLPVGEASAPRAQVLSTGGVVGVGLWMWLWLPTAAAVAHPLSVAAVWPVLCVRGGVAPSWLARSACEPGHGLRAFGQAFDDTAGMRGAFTLVELLALLAGLGIFVNLYALCSLGLLLAHSMFGIDVAVVSTFLSPDNTLVPLFVASLTLVLLEPLRAAISAVAFVDARSRRDGADLHAAIDAVIEGAGRRVSAPGARAPGAAALALLACGACLLPASAGHAAPDAPTADAPALRERAGDAEVRGHVETILAGHEFREFADQRGTAVSELLERFYAWLDRWLQSDRAQAGERTSMEMPAISPWVLFALALIAMLLIVGYVLAQRRARPGEGDGARSHAAQSERPPEPDVFLDEASRLAAAGEPRAALRALYVATLVTLDRARMIEFDPARTNWHYLRHMPSGELRDAFAAFTQLFDHKWYGHEETTMEDYRRGRSLADRVCAPEGP